MSEMLKFLQEIMAIIQKAKNFDKDYVKKEVPSVSIAINRTMSYITKKKMNIVELTQEDLCCLEPDKLIIEFYLMYLI